MKQGVRSMPVLPAGDLAAGVAFYTGKLGFDLAGQWKNDDGTPNFAIVQLGGITLGLAQSDRPASEQDWAAYFYLEDIDAFTDQVLGRGVKLSRGPEESFYHCKEVDLSDPHGNRLCFAQDLKPGADGPGL
ncbi:glyoxalase superfamily protein [Neptunicoccus sediminis]|uniref:glyoxalase superfamily protein n=1 Tax=Neptunicoccus sediminis TaxID=1892596 RepID=UPI0008460E96|nr:glyoxalase superfamily protein [Neptunicoccus sediminis]